MSKYTTEVRFICENASGLVESEGYNSVNDIITNALPKVFDFDFPIFDENYRSVLERKILKHYYTREIGEETVGLWKLRLDTRLNEIMPYYNKLYESELLEFNPLYTSNLTRTGGRTKKDEEDIEDKTVGKVIGKEEGKVEGNIYNTNNAEGYTLYSDTPQGGLSGVSNETYLTNATKNTNSITDNTENVVENVTDNITDTTNDFTRDREINSTENYLESVVGFSGTNASELIMKYRDTFLNIDVLIIGELEDLFIGLW